MRKIKNFLIIVIDALDDLLGHPNYDVCQRIASSSWWEGITNSVWNYPEGVFYDEEETDPEPPKVS